MKKTVSSPTSLFEATVKTMLATPPKPHKPKTKPKVKKKTGQKAGAK